MLDHMKKLLIVDDEHTIHKALQRTFRREPYELLHAYDAAEAWAVLERNPDVAAIVCDHYMPGMHGLDLLKDVRHRYPEMVTIILTAQADLNLVMSAINEGRIHKFFTKPWDAEDLRGQLRELIAGTSDGGIGQLSAMAQTERRMREQLLPDRDESGAFIIDAPDEEEAEATP